MENGGFSVVVRLNARLSPFDRSEYFDEPLQDMLDGAGLGEVEGGEAHLASNGERYCADVTLRLQCGDRRALEQVADFLEALGAPKGSCLTAETGEQLHLGRLEGLALYLGAETGADAVDRLVTACEHVLHGAGRVMGVWRGPQETAIYIYGQSFEDMRVSLEPLLQADPLCAGARVTQVA
jgi:hypothetical protein